MKSQTRGVDYFETISTFFEKNKIDWQKLISICTDGCPSMVGINSGLVTLIKNKIEKPKLINFHCITHRENLTCKFPNDFSVMNKTIKIVNFIRARDLNHRKFKEFLSELYPIQ